MTESKKLSEPTLTMDSQLVSAQRTRVPMPKDVTPPPHAQGANTVSANQQQAGSQQVTNAEGAKKG